MNPIIINRLSEQEKFRQVLIIFSTLLIGLFLTAIQPLSAATAPQQSTPDESQTTAATAGQTETSTTPTQEFNEYYSKGMEFIRNNQPDSAAAALERALSIRKDHMNALTNLTRAYLNMEQTGKAQDILRHAFSIDSSNSELYRLRGRLHHITGNLNQAAQAYQTALDLNENPYTLNNLAYVHIQQEQFSQAVPLLETAVKHRKEAYFYNNLGVAYHRTGETEKAREAFRNALDIKPAYAKAEQNLNNILEQISDRTDVEARSDSVQQDEFAETE